VTEIVVYPNFRQLHSSELPPRTMIVEFVGLRTAGKSTKPKGSEREFGSFVPCTLLSFSLQQLQASIAPAFLV
jgi:hypothetical protein